MKKVKDPAIRKTHPTLFKMITSLAIVNFAISFFLVTGDPQTLINFNKFPDNGIVPPLIFYAIGWTIAGYMLLYGLQGNGKYKWTRKGLVLSAMIGGFWAFGFWTSYLSGTVLGISAPLLWSFYSSMCVIITGEPVINPLNIAITNGLGNSEELKVSPKTQERVRKIKDQD